MMIRMMEDLNLLKGKAGNGTVKEIAKVRKLEVEKKKEAENRNRKPEDKVEAGKRAKIQKR